MKKIEFSLMASEYEGWTPEPVPAIKNLPNWYKNTSPYVGDSFNMKNGGNAMLTVKKCVPFLDAISSGYHILLNSDVFVDNRGSSEFLFNWSVSNMTIVDNHIDGQFGKLLIPEEYYSQAYKWINPWVIETPKGTSCLFTHPQNSIDLPFFTFSGVVDTDSYNVPINFPFVLKKNFHGVIEKGTPIAQVIPFQRDEWKMGIDKTIQDVYNRSQKYKSHIINAYRKMDWKRKSFK